MQKIRTTRIMIRINYDESNESTYSRKTDFLEVDVQRGAITIQVGRLHARITPSFVNAGCLKGDTFAPSGTGRCDTVNINLLLTNTIGVEFLETVLGSTIHLVALDPPSYATTFIAV